MIRKTNLFDRSFQGVIVICVVIMAVPLTGVLLRYLWMVIRFGLESWGVVVRDVEEVFK